MFTCFTGMMQTTAQNNKTVLGRTVDSTGSSLQGIAVQLYVPGSADTLYTVSNNQGYFQFITNASRFVIVVAPAEFKGFKEEYRFNSSYRIYQAGDIMLYSNLKTLHTVEVSVSAIILKEDTIEYKASLFNVKVGATVEDILKKLPGLEVNKNGEITAQGKPVYKIKVNGKDFFGNDLKMATRELPADIVDKIQVVDDYGELAARSGIKTDEPQKIINLQLKKNKSRGLFGNARTGYGSNDTYQAKISSNFFSDRSQLSVYGSSNNINNGNVFTGKAGADGSIMNMATNNTTGSSSGANRGIQSDHFGILDGISTTYALGANYRADFGKQNSFNGSYNYTRRNTEGLREQYVETIYPSVNYFNDKHFTYSNRNKNHQALLNMELHPDTVSFLKISSGIFFNRNNKISNTGYNFYLDHVKTSEGFNRDTTQMRIPALGISIEYNRSLNRGGRNFAASITANTASSDEDTRRPGFNRIYHSGGGYSDSIQDQQLTQNNRGSDYSIYLAYTEPFFKNGFIDLTWLYDYSDSKNNREVYVRQPGFAAFRYDVNLSEAYTNSASGNRVGLNYRAVKKKYTYTAGITIIPIKTAIDIENKDSLVNTRKLLNFSPLARFSYAFSKSKNLTVGYRGFNRRPGYMQLLPVRDISNQAFQKEGNPGLKPEFTHTATLSYNSFNLSTGSSLFTSFNFYAIQNKIINNSILLDSSGAQLIRPENRNGFYSAGAYYTFSKPFQKNRYKIKYSGSINYNHDALLVNYKKENAKTVYLFQGLAFEYSNNKWLEFGLEANYTMTSSRNLVNANTHSDFSSWVLSNNLMMTLFKNLVIKYDYELIINKGLDLSVNKNINLLNIVVEKKILKKKNLFLAFGAYNVFNQQFSLNRQVLGNSIIDSRSAQLSGYFICSLTYKWNKF
jgi:hypothetical protein